MKNNEQPGRSIFQNPPIGSFASGIGSLVLDNDKKFAKKDEDKIMNSSVLYSSPAKEKQLNQKILEQELSFDPNQGKSDFFEEFLSKKMTRPLLFTFVCYLLLNLSRLFGFTLMIKTVKEFYIDEQGHYNLYIPDSSKREAIIIATVSLVSIAFIPAYQVFSKVKLKQNLTKFLHERIINNVLDSDIYLLQKDLPLRIYCFLVTPQFEYTERIMPKEILTAANALSYLLALTIAAAYFVHVYLIGLFVVYTVYLRYAINQFQRGRSEFSDMQIFLKLKHNETLKGVIDGLNSIRAAKMEIYFKVQLNVFLERMMLTKIYLIGSRYLLKFKVVFSSILIIILGNWVFIIYQIKQDDDSQDARGILGSDLVYSIAFVFCSILIFGKLLECFDAFDEIQMNFFRLKTTMKLTNFDQESKVSQNS